jgi:glycosyl transferase family 87
MDERAMGRRRRIVSRAFVVVGVAVFAIYLGLWAALIAGGHSEQADYTAFYTGWTIVVDGRGADLYDPAVQAEVQRDILGGRTFEAGLNPFNNPPHLVVPFVPLAWLSLGASYLVWAVVQLGLLAWLLWRLWTVVAADWSRDERLVLIAASVAASPLVVTFLQGAFSLLVCVAVTEAYVALRTARDGRAGAWLALASVKPQAVVTLGVMLLVGRRWRAIAVGAVVGLALAAVATVVLGPGIWSEYLAFLSRYVSTFDEFSVRPSVMWNLRGTLTLLIGPDQAAGQATLINTVGLVGQLAGLAAVAWLWRGRWAATSPDFDLRFALTLLIGLLTSPHLNPHDDLLLVPAAAIAYRGLRLRPNGGWIGLALAASPLVILATNSISANAVEGPPVRVPVILMTAFAIVLAVAIRDGARHQSPGAVSTGTTFSTDPS